MRFHESCSGVLVALLLLSFGSGVRAQTLPSYVVDAQVPIVSSDGFNSPQGLAIAPDMTIYVADNGNHRVLKFAPDGSQTTVSFGTLRPAVSGPGGIALDGTRNLYVTDSVTNRLIKLEPGKTNGLAIIGAPILDRPVAVATDVAGNLAIVNAGNGTVVVRRAGGTTVLFNTGSTVLIAPTAVAFDNLGMLYVADGGNGTTAPAVYRFPKLGGTGTSVSPNGYPLKDVTAMLLDSQRNLFVLDAGSEQLIDVPANGGTPLLIPQSTFKSPSGLGVDSLGNFYVSDGGANSVMKLVYQNAANFGSVQVGSTSNTILFNYEFYVPTVVEATRGIGGGAWNAEYKKTSGGTCALRTYYPSMSSTGLMLPASCTVALSFTPVYPGGRPGAVELQTSNGMATQLTVGNGLGGQLALLNAPITPKLGSINNLGPMAVNYADTEIYFCGPGGTYKVPVAGGTPTLVTTQGGVSLALNGVGDLFLFNPPTITKIPADGSASTVINVPGLINPQAMAMDSNGAFYISDLGPPQGPPDYTAAAFVLRVSPTGVASILSPLGYWLTPSLMTSDGQGNIYVADGDQRGVFEVAAWTGDFTILGTTGPTIGGIYGIDPGNLAVDASGTVYYWDTYVNANFTGAAYSAPAGPAGPAFTDPNGEESQIPFYTEPPITNFYEGPGVNLAFHGATGNQTLMTSANGKLYFENGAGPGVFVVDRTQGYIPLESFNPNPPYYGGPSTQFYVYNVGNQNTTFTDATRAFTESGNGAGSFTFSVPPPPASPYDLIPCQSGITLAPGSYCVVGVTNTTPFQGGPMVTDTLHFLTDAVNNNSVSFRINGFGSPAP